MDGLGTYMHCIAFALLVLTCLVFSQRCHTDSFQVVVCTTCCTIHSALSPTNCDSITITPVLPIAFDNSRLNSLTQMASWPCNSTLHICFNVTLVAVGSGDFLVGVGAAWYGRFTSQVLWLLSRSTR